MKITFNKFLLGLALTSLGVFSSCNNVEEKATQSQTTTNAQMTGNTAGEGETPDVNPPHGQPGHRCDMPVGASLTGTSSNNTPPEMTTSPIRIKQDKPSKNPPHGEPYHDCTIPVGADLER